MSTDTESWFPGAMRRGRASLRVFCFPHAGAGTAVFLKWRKAAPPEWLVCPARLPGRESRLNELPFTDTGQLVSCLAQQIEPLLDAPFVLFGHSMGGIIAFELSRRLARYGRRLPEHLYLSGVEAPAWPRQDAPLAGLPDELLFEELQRRYGGVGFSMNRDPDLVQILLGALRADIALVESYRFVPGDPLACPITCYGGAGDQQVSAYGLASWRSETVAPFGMRLFPGGHFYLDDNCELVIEDMKYRLGAATTVHQ